MLTFEDLPRDFEYHGVGNTNSPSPYGAKGVEESGLGNVTATIGKALAQAITPTPTSPDARTRTEDLA